MGYATTMKQDIFADVIQKLQTLTLSQQKFIQDRLSVREEISTVSKKKLLKKSFGIWADRKDIQDSIRVCR